MACPWLHFPWGCLLPLQLSSTTALGRSSMPRTPSCTYLWTGTVLRALAHGRDTRTQMTTLISQKITEMSSFILNLTYIWKQLSRTGSCSLSHWYRSNVWVSIPETRSFRWMSFITFPLLRKSFFSEMTCYSLDLQIRITHTMLRLWTEEWRSWLCRTRGTQAWLTTSQCLWNPPSSQTSQSLWQ